MKRTTPFLIVTIIALSAALFINYLAVPNLLSHDQLHYELLLMKQSNPELFSRDQLFADTSYRIHFTPLLTFLRWINTVTGGSEHTYRVLVPITFFALVMSMFTFLYVLRVKWWISAAVAFLSTIFIRVLMDYWGIPGPSNMVGRFITLPFYPLIFLAFYKYAHSFKIIPLFFLIGLLGIIHQISALNATAILLLALLLQFGISKKTIIIVLTGGVLFLTGALPFLLTSTVWYPAEKVILLDKPYIEALYVAHSHLTPAGMLKVYNEYFITHWYYFWPLAAVSVGMMLFRRKQKQEQTRVVDKTSRCIIASTAIVTIGTTLLNQFALVVLQVKTPLVQEPRAFQFVYIPLYLYGGYAIWWGWYAAKFFFKNHPWRIGIVSIGILGLVGYGALYGIGNIQRLIANKNDPYRPVETCYPELYQWIKSSTESTSLFLIDPNEYGAFRICTERAVVYTYRDAPTAIKTNYLVEWARRKKIVEHAYENEPELIPNIAAEFQADFIVTKQCLAIPELPLIYQNQKRCCCVTCSARLALPLSS